MDKNRPLFTHLSQLQREYIDEVNAILGSIDDAMECYNIFLEIRDLTTDLFVEQIDLIGDSIWHGTYGTKVARQ